MVDASDATGHTPLLLALACCSGDFNTDARQLRQSSSEGRNNDARADGGKQDVGKAMQDVEGTQDVMGAVQDVGPEKVGRRGEAIECVRRLLEAGADAGRCLRCLPEAFRKGIQGGTHRERIDELTKWCPTSRGASASASVSVSTILLLLESVREFVNSRSAEDMQELKVGRGYAASSETGTGALTETEIETEAGCGVRDFVELFDRDLWREVIEASISAGRFGLCMCVCLSLTRSLFLSLSLERLLCLRLCLCTLPS